MPEQYRRCQTCGAEKLIADFRRPDVKSVDRVRVCAECAKEWKRTPAELARKRSYYAIHKERVRNSVNRYSDGHVEELRIVHRAGYLLRRAVLDGRIVRPTICEQCGTDRHRIQAAHHDYSKPFDVRWLCKPCHGRWDRAEPKIMGRLEPSA